MGEHAKHGPLVKPSLIIALSLLASPAAACRLALVLAMDVSSSVDANEDRLQRGGLAAALLAPEVQTAFFASPEPVALAAFEWSGRSHQTDLLDWTLIRSPSDLIAAAATIGQSTRVAAGLPTAVGHALAYASVKLDTGPSCLFETIDMAGDGVNNDGFGPQITYATFPFDAVTVNGLVIADQTEETLLYYETEVIRGPGSFVETAQGFLDFEAAMRRKLVRELSAVVTGQLLDLAEHNG